IALQIREVHLRRLAVCLHLDVSPFDHAPPAAYVRLPHGDCTAPVSRGQRARSEPVTNPVSLECALDLRLECHGHTLGARLAALAHPGADDVLPLERVAVFHVSLSRRA